MIAEPQIGIDIELADRDTAIVSIATPTGKLRVCATLTIAGRVLTLGNLHVEGLTPGALGLSGLNAIAQKIMDMTDVDSVIIFGATRTTGRRKGYAPRVVTKRRLRSSDG